MSLIEFLAARATPGVEAVTPDSYRRTIAIGERRGTIEVRRLAGRNALELRVAYPDPTALFGIIERVRRIFDLGADPGEIEKQLAGDPVLRPLIESWPGQRVPGGWDGFELGVRAILGQQVSVKGATTLAGRLAARFGEPYGGGLGLSLISPTPERLAGADLSSIGLPKARARAVQELARVVAGGAISFQTASADELAVRLREVPGIGEWTVQYVLMRALGEPDAFPASDLGLRRAAPAGGTRPTPKQLEEMARSWRPWRAYAAMYLWRSGRNG
ncbi:MAG: DNA-3-methyladenine glycosylase 2 family protein [bacterium]|nr:DNA-3-methyladenine glycosylase 2 family protein [bacterium]